MKEHFEPSNQSDQMDLNFTDPPKETPKVEQPRNYEVLKCPYCEDCGACTFCDRGLQWIADDNLRQERKKKRKGKKK